MSGVFHVGSVVVFLNMLVAMLSHSFERVRGNAEIEWKFRRSCTWMKYIRKGIHPRPPPMNIFPTRKGIARAKSFFKVRSIIL